MELEYKRELQKRYGIVFNRLYTITNMPISRFKSFLEVSGNYEMYMDKLESSFNPAALANVMCRNMVSVGWDGTLYDCDFNQMLEMKTVSGTPQHIRDFDAFMLSNRKIATGDHCYGCTAGAGSSCGGTVA
jgi:radical SAM/Cys-rich protein